ncbi:MAG: 2-oxoacid:acceptor oxidoreductase family protein [Chloroflexota bacterium]
MREEVVISGLGGQGVLVIGRLLAQAAILDGLNITWLPSYEATMRGGTVSCSIVLASDEIGSPVFSEPTLAIAMSQVSVDMIGPRVKSGGLLVVNGSMVERKPSRNDLRVVEVPASRVARELGNAQLASMVALGAFVKATRAVSLESVKRCMETAMAKRGPSVVSANDQALQNGFDFVR